MSLCDSCKGVFIEQMDASFAEIVEIESTNRKAWGMACPVCGRDDALSVELLVMAVLSSDGTDPVGDHDWGEGSVCVCSLCGWGGTVRDATVSEEEDPELGRARRNGSKSAT